MFMGVPGTPATNDSGLNDVVQELEALLTRIVTGEWGLKKAALASIFRLNNEMGRY